MTGLLLVQLLCCSFMTGVILIIQVLHYPAFIYIRTDAFLDFHRRHSKHITWIVMPVMFLELGTGLALVYYSFNVVTALNLSLLVAIWLLTAFVSVPIHNSLGRSQSEVAVGRLVKTNWPRTFLWSSRLILLTTYSFKLLFIP